MGCEGTIRKREDRGDRTGSLFCSKQHVQYKAEKTEEECGDKGGPEAGDVKSGYQMCRQIEHQPIDHESEQTECQQRDRQGQEYDDRAQKNVQQTDYQRRQRN